MKHVINNTKEILDVWSRRKQHYQALAKVATEVKLHLQREKKSSSFSSLCYCFILCIILSWKERTEEKNLWSFLEVSVSSCSSLCPKHVWVNLKLSLLAVTFYRIYIQPGSFLFPHQCFCFYWNDYIKSILNCRYIFLKIMTLGNQKAILTNSNSSDRPAESKEYTDVRALHQADKEFCNWISGAVNINVEEQTSRCALNGKVLRGNEQQKPGSGCKQKKWGFIIS